MENSGTFTTKLLAISGTIALVVYILLGSLFGAWAWAWIVFLVPGAIRLWQGAGREGHAGDEVPRPQRYEG